ncbi:hypothetical protein FRC03_012582 [Tulasnella sp. 419]|nr:hypothetical protein FRC03_012582 [Tulasnella sp. 419]
MASAQPETATPQRNPATGLPPELLEAIFLHMLHRNVAYRSFLLAYPLVCRTWSRPAQRVLFMDVTLYGTTKAAKFLRAIEGNPSLSHGTKLLGFGAWEGISHHLGRTYPRPFK